MLGLIDSGEKRRRRPPDKENDPETTDEVKTIAEQLQLLSD
jgi:hypothetical protein